MRLSITVLIMLTLKKNKNWRMYFIRSDLDLFFSDDYFSSVIYGSWFFSRLRSGYGSGSTNIRSRSRSLMCYPCKLWLNLKIEPNILNIYCIQAISNIMSYYWKHGRIIDKGWNLQDEAWNNVIHLEEEEKRFSVLG